MFLKVKKRSEDVMFKTQGNDSGYDVAAMGYCTSNYGQLSETKWLGDNESFSIEPGERVLIKTGLSMALPKPVETKWGTIIIESQVRPKSSLSAKLCLDVKLGTVDNEYRGEVGVTLKNDSPIVKIIKKGDKIGQLVFNRVIKFNEKHILFVDELPDSERGSNGYGSTGGIPHE